MDEDSGSGRWLGDAPTGSVWADQSRNPRRYRAGQEALTRAVRAWQRVHSPLHCVREPGPLGQPYRVVAGYGRLAAALDLKLATIPIVVDDFPEELAQESALTTKLSRGAAQSLGALTENMSREDMGSWDIAEAIGALSREGMDAHQICLVLAEEGGRRSMSPSSAVEYIMISGLSQSCKAKLVPLGKIGFGMARKLLSTPGLRLGKVWKEPETLARIEVLIGELVPADEEPEPGEARGDRVPGWRWRAGRMRELARTISDTEQEPSVLLCLALLRYAAGDDSAALAAEEALGPEVFKLVGGKRIYGTPKR